MRSYYRENPDDICFAKLVKKAKEANDYDVPRDHVLIHAVKSWGDTTGINATRLYMKDPTNVKDISGAEIDGLFTAGRCISATHEAESGIRYLPASFATGEAAGTAAWMAIRANLQPREPDVRDLRRRLVERGACLG